jgi:hypothetical protein
MATTTVDDYVAALPETQRRIAGALVSLVEAVLPGAGAIWHGHPVWSLGPAPGRSPVCLVKAHPRHVTFGFWKGQALRDPSGRLQAASREMAVVKLRSPEDVDAEQFSAWLREARTLEVAAAAPGAVVRGRAGLRPPRARR